MIIGSPCRFIVAATVAALVSACQGGIGDAPAESSRADSTAPAAASSNASAEPIDWSTAGDCLAKLRLLHAAAGAGRLAPGEDVPIAAVVRTPAGRFDDWMRPARRAVETDLPLAVHEPRDGTATDVPCLLEIGPARGLEAQHRSVGEDVVRSRYQSGTRSSKNPDYDVAEVRVRQAERELKEYGEPDILAVGDPMLDLIGIVAGGLLGAFSSGGEQEELNEALAELAATPRTLDRPVYRPYHFERTVIRGRKSAIVPVVLRDQEHGRIWRIEIRQRELREFHILDGLDPRDHDYAEHSKHGATRLELERWQNEPPKVPVSSAVAALVDEGSDDGTGMAAAEGHGDVTARRAEASRAVDQIAPAAGPAGWLDLEPADGRTAHPSPAKGDARPGSVVGIASEARSGSGFYVHENFVLTSLSLVDDAVLIDVVVAGGATVPGLLALSDARRDLALVHVPKPGRPAALADPLRPRKPDVVEAFRSAERNPSVTARVRTTGAVLELRSEASFSHDFAGGPVFSGDRVAGMVAASPEPASEHASAIPAADILDFLESARGEIAALP